MIAFGGAGPIHAAALADNMGISRLIVPLYPGLFSALGLLMADYRHDYIATVAESLAGVSAEKILDRYGQLASTARSAMIAEGVSPDAIRIERQIDLKYGYQMYEMTLPFPDGVDSSNLIPALGELFNRAHNQTYGYHRDDPIELVSLRLRALATAGALNFAELAAKLTGKERQSVVELGERQAFFGPAYGSLMTPLRRRFDLAGTEAGPMIIEEPDTTVVVPPGWTVERDAYASLVMTKV